jgi:hypothetical protein
MKPYLTASQSMITAAHKAFKSQPTPTEEIAIKIIIEAALLQRHKDKISAAVKKSHEKRKAKEQRNISEYIKSLQLTPTELRQIIVRGLRTAA